MCLIVALFKVVPSHPLIMGANRDERYARTGEPPRLWDGAQKIFAGRDPIGGGTWLGVNINGVLIALSNRKTERTDEPQWRSRGLLVLDVLAAESAASAIKLAQDALKQQPYNPFNLLCADARRAAVLHHESGGDRVVELPPGVHVITTGDVNDLKLPKIARAHSLIAKRKPSELDEATELLQRVCRDHGGVEPSAETLCMHGEHAGTVSSSIIAIHGRGRFDRYEHAQGFPCRNEYKTVFAMA